MSDKNKPSLPGEVTSSLVPKSLTDTYLGDYEVIRGSDDISYLHNTQDTHEPVYVVGSTKANAILRTQAAQLGKVLRNAELKEINELLTESAAIGKEPKKVNRYVAEIDGGAEVDTGDDDNSRIIIKDGKVKIWKSGSDTLFCRPRHFKPFPFPAVQGDLSLLDRYLGNLDHVDRLLLKVWLAYTLAHPKVPNTKYVILALIGGQGSGKTFLMKLISSLVSPSILNAQVMPNNEKDFAVAAQNVHVLFIDNVRRINQQLADIICVSSTGGYYSVRQLYTDGDQFVMQVHVAMVMNGIHDFINESDLAQRCLVLRLGTMDEAGRVSEKQLQSDFLDRDLPMIFRGLLDLIAAIFTQLLNVEVTNPERMIDFVQWLAAMECIDSAPVGVYQAAYSNNLREGQRESLLDDVLGEAIVEFAEGLRKEWKGEPKQLLNQLSEMVPLSIQRTSDWPKTPTALSRRLRSLQASLQSHGIQIEFGRDQKRWIRIETDTTNERF